VLLGGVASANVVEATFSWLQDERFVLLKRAASALYVGLLRWVSGGLHYVRLGWISYSFSPVGYLAPVSGSLVGNTVVNTAALGARKLRESYCCL